MALGIRLVSSWIEIGMAWKKDSSHRKDEINLQNDFTKFFAQQNFSTTQILREINFR